MSDQQSRNDRLDELLALAALGELTGADERELDAALARDVELQHELDADLDVAAQIQAVNIATPSPELKDRVMAAIDTPTAAADVPAPPVVDLTAERERRRPRWLPIAAAAAVAFIAVAGVVMLDGGDDSSDVVAEVVGAPDADEWEFGGELPGSLRAVYSAEAGALVLEGADIGQLTDSETYQLWGIDPSTDRIESVGVFRPDDDGQVREAFEGADPTNLTLGITVEPAGGSDEPTFPIVASLDTTA